MTLDQTIMIGFGVSEEDVQAFVSSNVGLCGVDTSRLSKYLLVQLASARKHRTLNTFAVTDVIQYLEGVAPKRGNTEEPRQFKGEAFHGLWKVHFFDARFLAKNLHNEWGMFSEKSKKFDKLLARVSKEEELSPSQVGWEGRLAYEFVVEGYKSRAAKQRITGEWLIFGVHQQRNFYLSLCTHTSSPEEDSGVYDALVKLCGDEFPDVFSRGARQRRDF
ncbi:hypothetical protein CJO94_12065 [Ralstonia solanacearum]|nr:hypothetical protein CJO94_12065 [Ralstonia solanacearum]